MSTGLIVTLVIVAVVVVVLFVKRDAIKEKFSKNDDFR